MSINIVLVEPRIPQNTGNIIRTCAVTGCNLHLVRPLGFVMSDKELRRAGLDYHEYADIQYYNTFDELYDAHKENVFYFATTKGEHLYTEMEYPDGCFIVFGREDAGLPESLLAAHRDDDIRIPMRAGFRSLNLSNSVAIVVYEALRHNGFEELNFIPDKKIF